MEEGTATKCDEFVTAGAVQTLGKLCIVKGTKHWRSHVARNAVKSLDIV